MSRWTRDPVTGEEQQICGMRSVEEIKSLMLEMCYPVGSIYISTKNVSPQTFLGGTWKSKSDYVLRGATSGVNFDSDINDGGADSVTVSSVASHNHTQNSHNHSQNSHGHGIILEFGTNSNLNQSPANNTYAQVAGSSSGTKHNRTNAVQGATATNIGNTATNIADGANYTVNTLPKYKNVYIWERTA